MSEHDVSDLMPELINEFMTRMRSGDEPTIEEYCQAHPDLASEIRDIFPTILVMNDVQEASDATGDERLERQSLPDEIGGYRIIGEIGRGGMGVVYEAEHVALGRRVALKVLPKRLSDDPRAIARFQREGRAIAKLHHTNIVPLFEIGNDGGLSYLAMQLIQGQSLDHVVQEPAGTSRLAALDGSPTSDQASGAHASASSPQVSSRSDSGSNRRGRFRAVARIGAQAAEALDYAHARDVIHRDVKPSNLILDESGVVWLTDFGLAKTDDDELTQTGDFLGTLRYMAPERFKGVCDERSDVYSLGLTLYELLTKTPAFQSSDRLRLIEVIGNSEPPRPRAVDGRIPRDLETIVLTAIDKQPRSRYSSARAMAEDLRRFLRDEPVRARRVSALERLLRWSRRNKRLAAALVGIGALLTVATIRESVLRRRAETSKQVAQQRGDALEQSSAEMRRNLYFAEMNVAGQSASQKFGSPTVHRQLERWKPIEGEEDLRGWEWYYLHAMTHREHFVSNRQASWVWSVDFNPTGDEYANVVNGCGIQVRSATTGEVVRDKYLGSARYVQWSPNGKQIAVSGFDANIEVCDAKTLEVVRKIGGGLPREVWCVKWSPDSKRLASSRRGHEGDKNQLVRIWDASNGELLQALEGHKRPIHEVSWSPDGSKLATAAGEENVRIWRADNGAELTSIPQETRTLCWSLDSKAIAIAHDAIEIVDAVTGNKIAVLDSAANLDAQRIRWRPGAQQIACGHGDGTLTVWDVETGWKLRTFYGHTGAVRDLAWNLEGTCLVSGGLDNTVRVWEVDSDDQTQVFPVPATRIDWNRQGTQLAATSPWENRVCILIPNDGNIRELDNSSMRPDDVRYSPDDRKIAYVGRDYLKVFDLQTERTTTLDQSDWFRCVGWAGGDSRLAAGARLNPDLRIWDSKTGDQILHSRQDHTSALDWNRSGSRLATGGEDGWVKVRGSDGELVWEVKRDTRISDIRWSPDGSQLASAEQGAIMIWDAASGREVATLDSVREEFMSVDWSTDASRLVSGSTTSAIIWDPVSGHVALRLPVEGANCVRWSHDGMCIAAAWNDVHIWDARRGHVDK